MAGVDSAGLGEVVQNVLAPFSEAQKARLVNVRRTYVCETPHPLPNACPRFLERIHYWESLSVTRADTKVTCNSAAYHGTRNDHQY